MHRQNDTIDKAIVPAVNLMDFHYVSMNGTNRTVFEKMNRTAKKTGTHREHRKAST
jgi:hypothetical protein